MSEEELFLIRDRIFHMFRIKTVIFVRFEEVSYSVVYVVMLLMLLILLHYHTAYLRLVEMHLLS
jgi:hypothetical protein